MRTRWVIGSGLAAGAVAATALRRRLARTESLGAVSHGGRAARTMVLARLGVRSGARRAAHQAKRSFASAERREALDVRHQLNTAADVAEALGEMKGALMKLGQMASYIDETMPEPMRDALASLQQDAPPMSPDLAASVVAAELGDRPERVFAEWDPTPIAAASIGQVHRAITRDGRAVAVKVQYPGVDKAIRADLDNTDLLFRIIAMGFPGLDPGPLVAELRDRIVEELDYRREADNQRLFADFYRDHPFIRIPAVVDELSTGRVLTTELATGMRFADIQATWSDSERNLAAETIFRFVFRAIYCIKSFNGDPHPGNYLFEPGGHVTFLDFGLVKHYTDDEVQVFEDLIIAMCFDDDNAQFRRIVERSGVLPPDAPISDEQVRSYFGHFYEFVLDDRDITFDAEYASGTVRQMFDRNGPDAAVAKVANVPPAFVVTQRINLGLHAVLAQLHARANWRKIAEEVWPFVGGPPSTALGELEAKWWAEHPTRRA